MRTLLALAAALLAAGLAPAQELHLPSVFGNHMVLQADGPVPFWGEAAPGAEVALSGGWWADPVTTEADAAGKWRVEIEAPGPGGPYAIVVQSGATAHRFADVLLGEVWVCGGQSNMEWTLGPGVGPGIANWEEEVAGASFPEIRYFDVPHQVASSPRADAGGTWKICTPENAGRFSAVGYLFGRRLHRELSVPVGLLGCNWGGTVAEAWTSRETLEAFGEFESGLAQLDAAASDNPAAEQEFRARQASWWRGLADRDPGSGASRWWDRRTADAGPWRSVQLPGAWEQSEPGAFDGIVWYRRNVEIPADWVGLDLQLGLGPIDDYDTTWVNGVQVGAMHEPGQWQTPRVYPIPASVVDAQSLSIAVRVLDTGGAGGFAGGADSMSLEPADGRRQALDLSGTWAMRPGLALSEVGQPPSRPSLHQNLPTALHNGMLRTIIPYAIRGAIWYQGESNRTRAYQYRRLFPAMIADWRQLWGRGDFPFYFVQIAPFRYGGDQGQAAALREAQTLALRVPQTGMAVTMDVGNPQDIHPKAKQEVGDRLARWALARTYGLEAISVSGPLLAGHRVEDGQVRLFFDHAHGGLQTRDGAPPSHLSVAGDDQVFHPAVGTVEEFEGRWTLVVRSEAVAQPVAVRYAWGAADQPNLINAEGLPAPSFRTDSWAAWPGGPLR